jgi:cytochrome c biogenesis factor
MLLVHMGLAISIIRDIYITMAQHFEDHSWGCRVYYKPFIRWIWFGVLLMAGGGLFAVINKLKCPGLLL